MLFVDVNSSHTLQNALDQFKVEFEQLTAHLQLKDTLAVSVTAGFVRLHVYIAHSIY